MAVKPVQVSIDPELLDEMDGDAEVRERGRSAFIRSAIRLYLDAKKRRETEARIFAAYDGAADAMLSEVRELLDDEPCLDE